MIIFLYGPDDWRREEKKRWYIKEFKKKYSNLGIGFFDFADGSASLATGDGGLVEFQNFIRNQSIFEEKKLVVLANVLGVEPEKSASILKQLLEDKKTTVLLSEREKPVKTVRFLLGKPAIAQKFEYLSGHEWEMFIKSKAKKIGLNLTDSATRFLGEVYKNNTWGLITELQKISSLKNGAVEKKDLAGLDLEIAPNYWEIFNGLKSREVVIRLVTLEKIFGMGEPAAKVFNILAAQWREKLPEMAEYDLKIKSGKLDYEEALILTTIC